MHHRCQAFGLAASEPPPTRNSVETEEISFPCVAKNQTKRRRRIKRNTPLINHVTTQPNPPPDVPRRDQDPTPRHCLERLMISDHVSIDRYRFGHFGITPFRWCVASRGLRVSCDTDAGIVCGPESGPLPGRWCCRGPTSGGRSEWCAHPWQNPDVR